jgi:hypothetical protein
LGINLETKVQASFSLDLYSKSHSEMEPRQVPVSNWQAASKAYVG